MFRPICSQQMRAAFTIRNEGRGTSWLLFCAAMVLMTLMATRPVVARPQDDVLSGVFRCAAIGDQKSWLDCFYGAAQPVRAALGLAPAPPSQSKLVTSPPSGTVSPA